MPSNVKSVVIDIADCHIGTTATMVRSVEFKLNGVLLQVGNGIGFTAYGYEYSADYAVANAFDVTKSKTGAHLGNGWQVNSGGVEDRIICVFDSVQEFDEIVINNHHDSGAGTTYGIKEVVITTSTDAITDPVYNAAITNPTVLFDGVIPEHVALDQVDDFVTYIACDTQMTVTTWYSDNNYGDPSYLEDDNLSTYVQGFTYCCGDFVTAFKLCTLKLAVYNSTAYTYWEGEKLQGSNDTTNGSDGTWYDLVTFQDDVNMSPPGTYPGWIGDITVNSATAYRYYRVTGDGTTNQVVSEWELYPVAEAPSPNLRVVVDMLYGDLTAQHRLTVDMLYAIFFELRPYVDMFYSLRLGIHWDMEYGDKPLCRHILNMHYWDAHVLRHVRDMAYGDLRLHRLTTDMYYHIPEVIRAVLDMRYGINGEQVRHFLDMGYDLMNVNVLRHVLDMRYMVQAGNLVQTIGAEVTIGGRRVKCSHINVEYSLDERYASCELHLALQTDFVQVRCDEEIVVTTILDGVEKQHHLKVEDPPRISRPGQGKTVYIVTGLSQNMVLEAPWSRPLVGEYSGDAETVVNDLHGDVGPVSWSPDVPSFPIRPGTLYANNEDAVSVIRKVTSSVGAKMQSDPDGSVRIIPAYPVPVNQWPNTEPDYTLTAREFISQDETIKKNPGWNKFLVTNQQAVGNRTWHEVEEVSERVSNVLGFRVPWDDTTLTLTHTGGDWVADPEYLGVVEELYPPEGEPAEEVSFVGGAANSSRPIYGGLEVDWLEVDLGEVSYDESGQMEAEIVDGESLGHSHAAIRYLTRYHLWKVRDDKKEIVLYVLWVDEES